MADYRRLTHFGGPDGGKNYINEKSGNMTSRTLLLIILIVLLVVHYRPGLTSKNWGYYPGADWDWLSDSAHPWFLWAVI